MKFRRGRFADLIVRQLDLFALDEAQGMLAEVRELEARYNRAGRDEAEQAYGDYTDAVEAVTEALAELRDRFARTLDERCGGAVREAFNAAVRKRWPAFGREIENS